MGIVHTSREALTEPGVCRRTSIEFFPDRREVVVTVEMSTEALADLVYEELGAQLKSSGFRLGPLMIAHEGVLEERSDEPEAPPL